MKIKLGRILFASILLITGCTYKEIPLPVSVTVDCTFSTLAVNEAAKQDATSCYRIDGSFTVGVTGGISPYVFSLNGASFQGNSTFLKVGPGNYLVKVRDANQCEKSINVEILAVGSTLAAVTSTLGDSGCLNHNGSITLTPSGGKPPYTFQLGTNDPVPDTVFQNLQSGNYLINMRDSQNCLRSINVLIARLSTSTSFIADIAPILNTNCSITGCHNGDNGVSINWTVFSNVQSHAQTIKTRTGNRSMPLTGKLTQQEINLIACWVDDGAKNN